MSYKINDKFTLRAIMPIFNKYFFGIFALFALAKILGKIDWNWLWVTSPIWGWWLIDFFYYISTVVHYIQNHKTLQDIKYELFKLTVYEATIHDAFEEIDRLEQQINNLVTEQKEKEKSQSISSSSQKNE